jgi:Tfp pilus assembly protein PilW
LSLVEVMVSMAVSLMLVLSLLMLFANTSRSNDDLARTNDLITDGRTAANLLASDIEHAGYWGGHVPTHDDLTYETMPADAPAAIPNPCTSTNLWDAVYRSNLFGIPVRAINALPGGAGCAGFMARRATSDVLFVNHAETCVPGVGNCDPDVAGRLYMQVSQCANEKSATTAAATSDTINFTATASNADDAYIGTTVEIIDGLGAGQSREITDYDGASRTATVSPNWTTIPNNTSIYSLPYTMGTAQFPLRRRDCATLAEKRRLMSSIYYLANVTIAGQTVPSLVRSQLDNTGGFLAYHFPVVLVEGVEAMRVELGIDNVSDAGTAVDPTAAIAWADPAAMDSPTNRGDGRPDAFVRCTTLAPCTPAQLANVVAVRLHLLTRSRTPNDKHMDTKSFCLATLDLDGTCPADAQVAAANDRFMRFAFTTTVRVVNVSGRRETP